MARKSQTQIRAERLVAELEKLAFDPTSAPYIKHRALATLSGLTRDTMQIEAERRTIAREKRKAKAELERYSRPWKPSPYLPDNGRGGPYPADD
jgi:hypothetical protein